MQLIFALWVWSSFVSMFESICKFIAAFLIAYEITVFWVLLQTSYNILFVPSWASCGSAGKASTCNVGDLGSIPGLGRFPWRRESLPTLIFWPREFHRLYSPWGRKELDTTEWLSLSLFMNICICVSWYTYVRVSFGYVYITKEGIDEA